MEYMAVVRQGLDAFVQQLPAQARFGLITVEETIGLFALSGAAPQVSHWFRSHIPCVR
jgi:hypothetical protein